MTDNKWHPNPAIVLEPKVLKERLVMSNNHIGKTVLWQQMRDAIERGDISFPTPEKQCAELKRAGMMWVDEASSISGSWFKRAWLRACREREDQVRECLGRWVSECEPTQIIQDGRFLGLGLDGGDGTVFVEAKPPATEALWFGWDLGTE